MKARLVIDADASEFDQATGFAITELEVVEVVQRDGLLSRQHEVVYAEGLTGSAAHAMGLPAGGPFIRVWFRPEEES